MEKLSIVCGIVIPLDRANVDTDAIIPKQFLKSIKRQGFGPNLFDEWRYLDAGEAGQDCAGRPLNETFVLNQPRYQGGSILLTQENFGCGSSREHAVWALADFGIRVIIAPSFADIFYNNTSKNGVLSIVLAKDKIDALFADVHEHSGYQLTVNLAKEIITLPSGEEISFAVDPFKKHCLLNGLDDIALTLKHIDEIDAYEKKRQQQFPWFFAK